MSAFRTQLCDLLGIEYPIVQSGMGGVAGPELVAEVCRAGGLGILAGLNVPPDDLRKMIRHVRELTDRPRSEEHTSELQSQSNLVCRLLLEKKKKKKRETHHW